MKRGWEEPRGAGGGASLPLPPPVTLTTLIGRGSWQFFIAPATVAGSLLAVNRRNKEKSDPNSVLLTTTPTPLESGTLGVGGHASPLTMFRIEDDDQETFPLDKKETQDLKLTWRGVTGGDQEPGSPASAGSPSAGNPELRRRIGSDPPVPDPEALDEVGAFRARSRSAPPILWAAQRYGRELRRMSDEFHGELQKMPRPKSAGTATQLRQTLGWKETLQSWWRRNSPSNGPRSPP